MCQLNEFKKSVQSEKRVKFYAQLISLKFSYMLRDVEIIVIDFKELVYNYYTQGVNKEELCQFLYYSVMLCQKELDNIIEYKEKIENVKDSDLKGVSNYLFWLKDSLHVINPNTMPIYIILKDKIKVECEKLEKENNKESLCYETLIFFSKLINTLYINDIYFLPFELRK